MAVTFKNPGPVAFAAVIKKMSYSHQRETALWIEEAKRAETRVRRIEKAVAELKKKRTSARSRPA